ncbi:MAG: 3-phosphoserine/phosphohydroxythreonine transaminase [Candidatus Omnitrophota bacterium]|nr:3-phosphoserine/phosphohydroxythreonine transaminase [Candidatus Omnitrophota bacterium]
MKTRDTLEERIYNFSSGPAALPLSVLEKVREELLNFQNTGMSVMEISHRSKHFEGVLDRAEGGLRRLLGISDDYAVLFLSGGARLQFSMIPMNLYAKGKPVDVINTGIWTQAAIMELERLTEYRLAASLEKENFKRLPRLEEIDLSPNASYVYIASNNTIYGTQWHEFPDTGAVPLVADMTSDILSRRIDISKFGLVFASAQKNLGPAGVTVVIIRKDLAEKAKDTIGTTLQYRTHIKHRSLYNTPPVFPIYVAALVTEWTEAQGGMAALEIRNEEKAKRLYEAIDVNDFYYSPIEKADRSVMNVVFRIRGDREDLEKQFVGEALKAGLGGLEGHRSIGGLRASIYNAQTLEGVNALIGFMKEFASRNG